MAAEGSQGLVRRAMHPPLRERPFWIVQAMVVALAAVHFAVDLEPSLEAHTIPTGIPIVLLVLPVAYAGLRYGLAGSVATTIWSTLLWLPDLLLPRDEGHPFADIIDLAVVDAIALFVGVRIEREHSERARAAEAERLRAATEHRYAELFQVNTSPILLTDAAGRIVEANSAAVTLLGTTLRGRVVEDVLGIHPGELVEAVTRPTFTVHAGIEAREFQLALSDVGPDAGNGHLHQIVLHDVTEERRNRTFATRLLDAQEDERQRIARELHDDPLQRLVQLARRMERSEGAFGRFPDGSEAVAGIRSDLLDVTRRLRDVARGLRPPGLEELGLPAALRGLLADAEEEADVHTTMDLTGDVARLEAHFELGVFRIAQEAVRNALRHAACRRIWLLLEYGHSSLKLRIADDGRGFDTGSPTDSASEHLGIVGMRERANLLGGRLHVDSTRGRGTEVELNVPIRLAAVAPEHPALEHVPDAATEPGTPGGPADDGGDRSGAAHHAFRPGGESRHTERPASMTG